MSSQGLRGEGQGWWAKNGTRTLAGRSERKILEPETAAGEDWGTRRGDFLGQETGDLDKS